MDGRDLGEAIGDSFRCMGCLIVLLSLKVVALVGIIVWLVSR